MSTSHDSVPATEGPLAHDARTTEERSYLDGLAGARRDSWERASGARPERTPKRVLVALSHSIERAVMSGPIEDPTVVVAMFQQLRFFDREREVYERLAEAGVNVVVGFVDGGAHDAPRGVQTIHLRPDEPLADEWSVVALGPQAGAFLVAKDQHSFDPDERDREAGREFVGRWGYSRAQAGTELARLRFVLGDRLDADVRRTVDGLLAEHMPSGGDPASSAGTPGETWATSSLNHMLDGMLTATAGTRELREQLADAQSAAAALAAATTDPQSGLSTPDFLQRWSHPAGADPLPIGLALFDVAELGGDAIRSDERASYFAAHQVAAALNQPLGPVDAVVRLSAREFLLVVPGASTRHLAGLCDRIGEQLELASHGYPDISLRARVATVVTRRRPLPVEELHGALDRLGAGTAGPVDGGELDEGDRVVVSSTALYAAGPDPSQADGAADVTTADPTPPHPRPEVSPLGHTAVREDASPPRPSPGSRNVGAPAPDGPRAAGAHRSASPSDVDQQRGPAFPGPPGGDPAEQMSPRTAQDALRRLVYGDPRAQSDVFVDLSDPTNGRHGPVA